jgi:hypothetical protein
MALNRAFISFDFDHDEDLRNLLAGQARHPDSPFEIKDRSVTEPLTGDWKAKVERRMANIDVVIVLCGEYTHTARGVSAELEIARDTGTPYFLLAGRSSSTCTRPTTAVAADKMYKWTWDNLKQLIGGGAKQPAREESQHAEGIGSWRQLLR